jgi:hypothetical protein
MASLYNTKISETYQGLMKTIDNNEISTTPKILTDGQGNESNFKLGTNKSEFTGTLDLTNATVVGLSTGAVDSVNGQTGVVVLTTSDISEGTNLYFTDARVQTNNAVVLNTAKISFPEAPNDGQQYARQSQGWSVVVGGTGLVDSVNGQTGIVVLDSDNITQGSTNLYYSESLVTNNVSVLANTAKIGITTAQTNDIVVNNAKVGISTSQANEISANTLKTGITTQQATDITNNNVKVGITTNQASDITTNNAKVTFPEAPNNGQQYARQSEGWSVVSGGGAVDSVNGATGTVVLDTDNINEGTTNLYYTEARVSANSNVALNTAKVGITSQQATDITNNNAKVGITTNQANEIAVNTLKVGITTQQATDITNNNNKVGITTAQANEIAANTLKTGITSQQATDITNNNAKVGYTDALVSANSDVVANTAKTGITTAQADDIVLNTAKVGITSSQATAITDNTAKNSYPTVDADKLFGIETGAEVNDVDSVNGATGVVSLGLLDLDDVGSDGASGQVLTTDGNGAFTFTTVSSGGGGVSSVTGSGTVSGLTLTTGGTAANIILTLGGTLSLTSANVTDALTYTPYNSTNPDNYDTTPSWVPNTDPNYLTGITSSQVTTALTFTPYSDQNPDNFISSYTVTNSDVTSALGFTPYSNANPSNFISTYTVTNSDVTTALGFTPYNNTNPSNFTSNLGIVQSVTGNTGVLEIVNGVLNVPPTAGAPVDSVNGATGVVVLDTDNISEGTTNKYMILGTTASTALAGNTDLLQIGLTSTTALAGNTTTISGSQATAIIDNSAKVSFVDAPSNGNEYARKNGAWVVVTDADSVTSVNTQTGAVVLDTGDIAENGNLYFTDARVSTNAAVSLNTAKVGFTQTLVSQNTDVTNNTAKVGNVQSDWNATSGLAVILNKPTIPSAAPVDSVNGEVGTVVLDTSDIAENTNLYFTDARVSSNSAVTLNTAKVGITSAQAADITDNNTKVSMVIGTAANEAMAGNTTTISAQQITDISNNNDKISFDTTSSNKLNGIEDNAEVNVQSDWNATSGDAFILNKPTIPSAAPVDSVNGATGTVVLTTANIAENTNLYYTESRVSSNTNVSNNTAKISFDATSSAKLSNIEEGAQVNTVDSVNGNVGAVTLTTNNVAEGTNKYMVLGTTASTALAGDTALLQLGTSSTTALAGDTALLQLGTSSTTALAGDTTVITAQQATDISDNNDKISFDTTSSTKLGSIETGAEVNTIDSIVSGEPNGSDQVINVVSLSQTEYDNGTKIATTFYIIT